MMSNDNYILKAGVQYTLTFPNDPDQKSFPFTCHGFINAGQVVDVFEMRSSKGTRYALKIPRDPSRTRLVEEEYHTLVRLEESQKKPITPTGNHFVVVQLPNDQTVKGLLMRYLDFPRLADFYQEQVQSAGNRLEIRLDAENIAWYAASQYLDLIELQLEQKKISLDRKRDTFLWDETHDNLIVTDWNVMETVERDTESKAVYTLSQIWFTLFTQLQPTAIPPLWDDARWDYLTLEGRDILLQLLGRDVQTVAQVKKLINPYVKKLNQATPDKYKTLVAEFEAHLGAWEARPQPLTRRVVENQFMPLVYLADILRRLSIPQQFLAQEIYDYASQAIEVRGEVSDPQLSAQRNLDKVREYRQSHLQVNEDAFLDLREAILKVMSQHEALKNKLFALEEAFRIIPNNFLKRRMYASDMKARIDDIAESLQIYGVDADAELNRFRNDYVMIEMAYQADDALVKGDFSGALDLYQNLRDKHNKTYPLERYTHLTIEGVLGIIELLSAIEGTGEISETDPRRVVKEVRKDFLAFVDISLDNDNRAMLEGRVKRWKTARLSAQLSVYDALLLSDYIYFAELIFLAYKTDYVRGQDSHHLAYELGRLRRRLPDDGLKKSIIKSQFCKSLHKKADEAYKLIEQVADHAEDRHLRFLYEEEAHYLYQLIYMLK